MNSESNVTVGMPCNRMRFFPAGDTVCHELLDLPQQQIEWVITGATADQVIAAGFLPQQGDECVFIHPESGDRYRLARRQSLDKATGQLHYRCGVDITLEDELETRVLTILAMARDGTDIIDPFDGREDLSAGVLRHVTPHFSRVPANLLIVAVWAASLSIWGFSVAHGTHALMKRMVESGALEQIARQQWFDAVLRAMASPRPSAFFRVLHRCGALRTLSQELDALFEERAMVDNGNRAHFSRDALPDAMQALDRAAAATGNVSSVLKRFHEALGNQAEKAFKSLGLDILV